MTENGMIIGAQDEYDQKIESEEYRQEWIKRQKEFIIDELKDGYGVAFEVDAVDALGKILTLYIRGAPLDELYDCLGDVVRDYAKELAAIQFFEADHDEADRYGTR